MTYAKLVKEKFFGTENPNRTIQPAWDIAIRHHKRYCQILELNESDLEKLSHFGRFFTVVASHENIFFFVSSVFHNRTWQYLLMAESETGKGVIYEDGTKEFTTLYEGMYEKCIQVLEKGINDDDHLVT